MTDQDTDRINVNTVSEKKLRSLPLIGESRSASIVRLRNQVGTLTEEILRESLLNLKVCGIV